MIEIRWKSPCIIEYSKGPNREHYILLLFIAADNETTRSVLHIWLWSVKNDITHFTITDIGIKIPRSTISNALLKSIHLKDFDVWLSLMRKPGVMHTMKQHTSCAAAASSRSKSELISRHRRGHSHCILNGAIRWRISISINIIHWFLH